MIYWQCFSAPTQAPTSAPTESPTQAPTPIQASKYFIIEAIAGGIVVAIILTILGLCVWKWRKSSKIIADFDHAYEMVLNKEIAGDQAILFFEEIKKDLLEQAKNILLASNALMGKKSFTKAIHQEIFLLSKYFLTTGSLEAFQIYKKFIQDNSALYATRKPNWGQYPSLILEKKTFLFNDTVASLEEENKLFLKQNSALCAKTQVFHFNESSALMLLLTLPHLDSAELEKINQEIYGFTLLHRIVIENETPLAILCVLALLDCGANPNILGVGSLSGIDLDNQSPTHCAKRLNKVKFFSALTHGADINAVILPSNASERKQEVEKARRAEEKRLAEQKLAAERRAREQKLAAEKAQTDGLLTRCLQYILNNDVIAKVVTDDNKADFLQTAIELLETSSHFATFKTNVLNRQDYDLGLYTHFKQEVTRSIRDLKLKFSPTQCEFEQEELVIIFSNTVLTYQRELDQHDTAMKTQMAAQQAHQATVNAQETVAKTAQDRNSMLFHEQEARRHREEAAAEAARRRANIQTGMRVAQFAMNNF